MKIRLNPKYENAQFAYKFAREDGSFFGNEWEWRWETKEDADYDLERMKAGLAPLKTLPMYEGIP